jgi:hypothetical protein
MKHVRFADKDFLVGNDIADAILEYAAVLGEMRSADSIDIVAVGPDGDEVEATLFLSTGVPLVAETTTSRLPEPDNAETLAYIEARLALHLDPASVEPALGGSPLERYDQSLGDWAATQE